MPTDTKISGCIVAPGGEPHLSKRLAERFRELAALTILLKEREKAFEDQQETVDWLGRLGLALYAQPRWWSILPARWRTRQRLGALKLKGIFDADSYRRQNPDVAETDIDPLVHYLLHGLSEGRPRELIDRLNDKSALD